MTVQGVGAEGSIIVPSPIGINRSRQADAEMHLERNTSGTPCPARVPFKMHPRRHGAKQQGGDGALPGDTSLNSVIPGLKKDALTSQPGRSRGYAVGVQEGTPDQLPAPLWCPVRAS